MRIFAQTRNLEIPGSLALLAPRNDDVRFFILNPQYDFGRPSTFSAIKLRMSCGLIGAMRGIRDSRK
jgi:hypothetical protein